MRRVMGVEIMTMSLGMFRTFISGDSVGKGMMIPMACVLPMAVHTCYPHGQ